LAPECVSRRAGSRLDPFKAAIDESLVTDLDVPASKRYTAIPRQESDELDQAADVLAAEVMTYEGEQRTTLLPR
jgi:hypothetical protein